MTYRIGTTVAVDGGVITVLLDRLQQDAAGTAFGVPETMGVHLPGAPEGALALIGQPGSFVEVSTPAGSVLCMVTAVRKTGASAADGSAESPSTDGDAARLLTALAIGTLKTGGTFERGADVLPTVGVDVCAVSDDMLRQVYSNYSEGAFALGKLALLPDQDAIVNLDALLSRHLALLSDGMDA